MQRRLTFAFTLMMTGKLVLTPSIEKLLIYPCLTLLFMNFFGLNIKTSIIWSFASFNGFGLTLILLSLLIGGKILVLDLNSQLSQCARRAVKRL